MIWGNPAVMNVKITADNFYYWGCLGLLFFHRKLTDLDLMAAVRPDVERMQAIITRLEAMYREWNELERRERRRAIVPWPPSRPCSIGTGTWRPASMTRP